MLALERARMRKSGRVAIIIRPSACRRFAIERRKLAIARSGIAALRVGSGCLDKSAVTVGYRFSAAAELALDYDRRTYPSLRRVFSRSSRTRGEKSLRVRKNGSRRFNNTPGGNYSSVTHERDSATLLGAN